MDGYSRSPLAKKLGVREGARVALVSAPDNFQRTLGKLPEGAMLLKQARAPFDVVVFFNRRKSHLDKRLGKLAEGLEPAGGLWVAWPKRSSEVETDLSFDVVQKAGLELGLVDNKVCAIDETWSGLRFVRRLSDR